jgi:hypothetical protein
MRKKPTSVPRHRPMNRNMARSYNASEMAAAMLLISRSASVLVDDKGRDLLRPFLLLHHVSL